MIWSVPVRPTFLRPTGRKARVALISVAKDHCASQRHLIVRFDEPYFFRDRSGAMSSRHIRALQRYYPQIYLACHVDHVRTKSNPHHLSAHDSTLLAHLDESKPTLAGQLAQHLGIANSTLSAALKRLDSLGHLKRTPSLCDKRQSELRLTARGATAMAEASVLDAKRVGAVLAELTPSRQKQAVAGLALLAGAALDYQAKAPRRKRW